MHYLITYGSQYGSTEKYARTFAEKTGIAVIPYYEVNNVITQYMVIHFGALYAGGVMGLKSIVAKLPPDTQLIIATVGLADVKIVVVLSNAVCNADDGTAYTDILGYLLME